MQILLAADTSTAFLTLGLCARDASAPDNPPPPVRLLGELTFNAGRRHAEAFYPSLQTLLGQCSITLPELTHLAVTIGPGSFTGLRIGVAAMKGLAYALNLPLAGVPTLDLFAGLHPWRDADVCVMLDARMAEVFTARYHFEGGVRHLLRPACALSPEAALEGLTSATVFCGDGALRYADVIRTAYPGARILPEVFCAPRAAALACEAYTLYDAGAPHDAARVEPVYLRKTQAEFNRDKKEAAAGQA